MPHYDFNVFIKKKNKNVFINNFVPKCKKNFTVRTQAKKTKTKTNCDITLKICLLYKWKQVLGSSSLLQRKENLKLHVALHFVSLCKYTRTCDRAGIYYKQ